ncbi:hypothetical protein K501DRAFT_266470 [Backusella circina FSU 941]|nr:hypothetical protein K501DRAFT_266470 [Backusella circina FSU 941]
MLQNFSFHLEMSIVRFSSSRIYEKPAFKLKLTKFGAVTLKSKNLWSIEPQMTLVTLGNIVDSIFIKISTNIGSYRTQNERYALILCENDFLRRRLLKQVILKSLQNENKRSLDQFNRWLNREKTIPLIHNMIKRRRSIKKVSSENKHLRGC